MNAFDALKTADARRFGAVNVEALAGPGRSEAEILDAARAMALPVFARAGSAWVLLKAASRRRAHEPRFEPQFDRWADDARALRMRFLADSGRATDPDGGMTPEQHDERWARMSDAERAAFAAEARARKGRPDLDANELENRRRLHRARFR